MTKPLDTTIQVFWFLHLPGPASWPRPLLGLVYQRVGTHRQVILYIANQIILSRKWKRVPCPTLSTDEQE